MAKMSAYSETVYTTVIPIIAGFVVILNIFEVALIVMKKRTKLTPSLIYLLNLSLSDIFVGIVMIVLKSLDPFIKTTLKGDKIAKEVYGVLKHVFVRLSLFLSIFGLIALTFDRLFAITAPFRHRKRGKAFPYKVCLGVWVVSICCVTLVYCISRFHLSDVDRYNNLVFPISTFAALLFFITCYTAIFVSIRRSQENANGNSNDESAKQKEFQKQVRFVMLALKTVIIFALCWLPFSTCNLLKANNKQCGGKDVERTLFAIAFFNSVLNPFVYFTHKKIVLPCKQKKTNKFKNSTTIGSGANSSNKISKTTLSKSSKTENSFDKI